MTRTAVPTVNAANDMASSSLQQAVGAKDVAHHLRRGRLNFSILRDAARRALSEALASVGSIHSTSTNSNSILLVWDAALMKPFGLIAGNTFLKENGVTCMWKLDAQMALPPSNSMQNVAVLVRAEIRCMPLVAAFVKREKQLKPERDFYLIMVPAQCSICRDVLKAELQQQLQQTTENALSFYFTKILDCPVDMYPMEYDVLSLELHSSFKDCFVDQFPGPVHRLAQAIAALQSVYGLIPHMYAKGTWSKRLLHVLETMQSAYGAQETNKAAPKIDNLLVFDRTVDLVSVLPMQSTYEGLIDEFFGIYCTAAKFPTSNSHATLSEKHATSSNSHATSSTGSSASESKVLLLNSADNVYADIRDKSFNAAGYVISRKTRELQSQEAEIKASKTLDALKVTIPRIKHYEESKKTLANHVKIAELLKYRLESPDLMETRSLQLTLLRDAASAKNDSSSIADEQHTAAIIERYIAEKRDFHTVLRLIALQAHCRPSGGLKLEIWQNCKKILLRSYGFENILTIENLEEAGFFGQVKAGGPWLVHANQSLRLFSPLGVSNITMAGGEAGGSMPNDVSYVFNGAYAPITARIAQKLAKPGWNSILDALNTLPGGELAETFQQISTDKHGMASSGSSSSLSLMFDEPRTTLVVFIGGVTYAEIAALRLLSQQEDLNMEYIVLTTHIINGSRLIESCSDKLEPRMF